MKEIQITIAIANNLLKTINQEDRATPYQLTFKTVIALNKSKCNKLAMVLIRPIHDQEV